jgi:hypothetical protein
MSIAELSVNLRVGLCQVGMAVSAKNLTQEQRDKHRRFFQLLKRILTSCRTGYFRHLLSTYAKTELVLGRKHSTKL